MPPPRGEAPERRRHGADADFFRFRSCLELPKMEVAKTVHRPHDHHVYDGCMVTRAGTHSHRPGTWHRIHTLDFARSQVAVPVSLSVQPYGYTCNGVRRPFIHSTRQRATANATQGRYVALPRHAPRTAVPYRGLCEGISLHRGRFPLWPELPHRLHLHRRTVKGE